MTFSVASPPASARSGRLELACALLPAAALWVLESLPWRIPQAEWIEAVLCACALAAGRELLAAGFAPIIGRPWDFQDTVLTGAALTGFLVSFLLGALHAAGRLPSHLVDPRGGPVLLYLASATVIAARRARDSLGADGALARRQAPEGSQDGTGPPRRRETVVFGASLLSAMALTAGMVLAWGPGRDVLHLASALIALLGATSFESMRFLHSFRQSLRSRFALESGARGDCPDIGLAAKVDTVVFQRTGVLTKGRPEVAAVHSIQDGFEPDDVLHLAAVAEYTTAHPIRDAILRRYQAHVRTVANVSGVRVFPARGIHARLNGRDLLLGNTRLYRERGWDAEKILTLENKSKAWSTRGDTVLFAALGEDLVGAICLSDPPRPDAEQLVAALGKLGVRTVVLSGDSQESVSALCRSLGEVEAHGSLLPDERRELLARWRAEGRAMGLVTLADDACDEAKAQRDLVLRLVDGSSRGDGNRESRAGGGKETAHPSGGLLLRGKRLMDVAAFLSLARRTARTERRCFALLGFYHLAILPLLCGALYRWTGLGPSPALAALLGAFLPLAVRGMCTPASRAEPDSRAESEV